MHTPYDSPEHLLEKSAVLADALGLERQHALDALALRKQACCGREKN